MYGLPDSAILGTAKRLSRSGRRRRSSQSMSGLEVLSEVLRACRILYLRYQKTRPKK